MLETREYASLDVEALRRTRSAPVQQFDRCALFKVTRNALRLIYDTHAAATHDAQGAPYPDAPPRRGLIRRLAIRIDERGMRRLAEEFLRGLRCIQQAPHLLNDGGILESLRLDPLLTPLGGQIKQIIQQRIHL
jgi:hypothetical protein